ncbi:putative membrane protein [Mucilaginibacter sp. SG538B]|uniref:SRPBCC family protein n=1 Tax=Mucilaginibacter sp. SG538B TaxID=2587021 RepID=UPI00159E9E2A|nr:SRPBCC family protein [Mucilaginibacter sp. SG538B]NVM63518.1 putative membrane protein [Mucilaginibacter sp. SG538B]
MATTIVKYTDNFPVLYGDDRINLNWPERFTSIAGGMKLGFSGFKNIFKNPFASIVKIGAGGYLLNRGITGHCELYKRIGKLSTNPINVNIRSSFIVNKPRQKVYEFWRKLDNLPLFMKHLESVEVIDSKYSHWALKLPKNVATISWHAEIVHDEPNEVIGWSSLSDSMINNAGKIRFQDTVDGQGTIVDVVISYQPPAGGVGAGIAKILNPVFKNMVDKDIQNFKQYMDINNDPDEFVEVIVVK